MNNEKIIMPKIVMTWEKGRDENGESKDTIQGCFIHDPGDITNPRNGTRRPIVKSSSRELRNIKSIDMVYVLFCFLLRRRNIFVKESFSVRN
jgi:hypothetical protein